MNIAQLPRQPLPESDCFHDESVVFYIRRGPFLFQCMYIFSSPPTTHHNQGPGSTFLTVFSQALPGTVRSPNAVLSPGWTNSPKCSPLFSLLPINFALDLSTELLPSQAVPILDYWKGLSPFPEAGHLSSWNFKQLLLACFPACPGSSGQQPSSEAHQLSLLSMGSSTNWTNASLIASFASLIKLLNTTGLRIDICGTTLVTPGKVWPINHNPLSLAM